MPIVPCMSKSAFFVYKTNFFINRCVFIDIINTDFG